MSCDGEVRPATHYSTSLDYDVRRVAADAARRRVLQALISGQSVAGRPSFDPETDIDAIRQGLDAAVSREIGRALPTVGDLLIEHLEELEQPLGDEDAVPPPYADLMAMLPGLRPGQLVVVGARPGVGKSVVSLDWARYAAIQLKLPVLYVSLEMSNAEIMNRLIAAEARVDLGRINAHALTDDDRKRIAAAQGRIFDAPLVLDDSPHVTVGHIRARLRGMARTAPCRLLIIDYLALMTAPKAESREREVAELSRALKLIAKEFEVPIIAAHQLNRESTKRADKRPALADLRESGAVEQDADIVILLHREDIHDRESPRAGEIDIAVEKNRNGPRGLAVAAFQGHFGRAVDMARDPKTPPTDGRHLRAVN
jgi:replicative DNA helicase